MEVDTKTYALHELRTEPQPLRAELYNVGNFEPIPVAKANFTAAVKSNDLSGACICGMIKVFLITNGVPICMSLSDKGCIAALDMYNGRAFVSGKTADLSGFGVKRGKWTKTEIKTSAGKLQLLVDNHIEYETSMPLVTMKVLGLAFEFYGGGAVKSIQLNSGNQVVFKGGLKQ
ncbi:hypothetical protein [Mucilaginibacter sp.]|uniref:hypothetical protein n=1 Tax=Mucilaginibacter sp. TaxID=1882438 RepID=UPI000CC45B7A|nr:hypothetical protein [Mucilaginibacter sp.]PLW91557.1 MAG: hypothetical protein C0154_00630 [Mucilaginibacter sp.]HEK21863.1 hypothetical protein [Bacteroidota bacterium]